LPGKGKEPRALEGERLHSHMMRFFRFESKKDCFEFKKKKKKSRKFSFIRTRFMRITAVCLAEGGGFVTKMTEGRKGLGAKKLGLTRLTIRGKGAGAVKNLWVNGYHSCFARGRKKERGGGKINFRRGLFREFSFLWGERGSGILVGLGKGWIAGKLEAGEKKPNLEGGTASTNTKITKKKTSIQKLAKIREC